MTLEELISEDMLKYDFDPTYKPDIEAYWSIYLDVIDPL